VLALRQYDKNLTDANAISWLGNTFIVK
jgi:hypothetical protein